MRMPGRPGAWFRLVLSLVLLAANVAAPFRSGKLDRVMLNGPWRHVATSPVVRVRVMAQVAASQGFRAVVGFVSGGRDEASGASGPRSALFASVHHVPTYPVPPHQRGRALALLHSPLRC